MCLLALFFRCVDDAPVVAGANREEEYARGGEPPRILNGPIPAIAGIDPVAGGTWFGVNMQGVLIAVTNRRRSGVVRDRRSRGLLALDLLKLPSAAAARDAGIRALEEGRYDGCNVLCVDARDAVVLEHGEWLRVRPLPPGIHVVANREVNDEADPRVAHARHSLTQRHYAGSEHCLLALRSLCGQHEAGYPPMCLHGETRGTVSSTVAAIREQVDQSLYQHAQGPPDRTPYEDYSYLFQEASSDDG